MRPLIIYCSRTGNTEKIVRFMGEKLGEDIISLNRFLTKIFLEES